jgi:hypothetical protein
VPGRGFDRLVERVLEGRGEVVGSDPAARTGDGQPLERIVQLPDVPLPGRGAQTGHGRIGQHRRRKRETPGDAGEAVVHQPRHVLATLAQGRQAQAGHRDAVVEIGPEAAGADRSAEVAARRRHHPRRAVERFPAPQALEAAILEDPQQAGLQGRLELADLVEEQRAVSSALDPALAAGRRAREGAALVPEELALEERGGQRGAVGVHEGAAATGEPMQQPRRHALAGARLAGHQHGRVERSQPQELCAQGAHRSGFSAERLRREVGRRRVAIDRRVDRQIDLEIDLPVASGTHDGSQAFLPGVRERGSARPVQDGRCTPAVRRCTRRGATALGRHRAASGTPLTSAQR